MAPVRRQVSFVPTSQQFVDSRPEWTVRHCLNRTGRRCARTSALARDDVEEVPVLGRPDGGRVLVVELLQALDLARCEHRLDFGAGLDDDAARGPLVVDAEDLA